MRYTIVYQNVWDEKGLISWLGNTCDNEQEAQEIGKTVCRQLKEEMPYLTFFVLRHTFEWITKYED